MAAVSLATISPSISYSKRRPLALTERRLAANRRNAARSTGPRTPKGKARVARNAIKHGFFADPARWTEQQQRDFAVTFLGLCDDFRPQSEREELCVAIMADSFVRMAAVWRYEGIAALKYHQQCDREMDERIAAAEPSEAARLTAHREEMRRAGLWRPTIPGPRAAAAIIRYEGRLHRAIRDAIAELEGIRATRSTSAKVQKQTHFVEENPAIFSNRRSKPNGNSYRAGHPVVGNRQGTSNAASDGAKSAKTNPLSSVFTGTFSGNRHQRRRAAALARRRT
jgi:hypothetical protein